MAAWLILWLEDSELCLNIGIQHPSVPSRIITQEQEQVFLLANARPSDSVRAFVAWVANAELFHSLHASHKTSAGEH